MLGVRLNQDVSINDAVNIGLIELAAALPLKEGLEFAPTQSSFIVKAPFIFGIHYLLTLHIALSHTEFEEVLDNMPLLVCPVNEQDFIKL